MTDRDDAQGGATGGHGDGTSRRRDVRYSRRRILAAAGATGGAILAGCLGDDTSDGDGQPAEDGDAGSDGTDSSDRMDSTDEMSGTDEMDATDDGMGETTADGMGGTATEGGASEEMGAAWATTELETVRDGETFTVAELEPPVVVQTFAVWCPKCKRQQEALRGVEDATVVSLNVDSNEGGEQVATHANDNGFDWRFAVAPGEVTQSLIDEFGTDVATPPSSPIVFRCADGSASFRSGNVLDTAGIRSVVDEC